MLEFKKISDFPKGILYEQLCDAYSFDNEYQSYYWDSWMEYETFMYSDLENITNKCGFVTVLDGIPIGHITWDLKHKPLYAKIKQFCIISQFKGKGYGHEQLLEAIHRIKETGVEKIIGTTNEKLEASLKTYEGLNFTKVKSRTNIDTPFAGNYEDYELRLRDNAFWGK